MNSCPLAVTSSATTSGSPASEGSSSATAAATVRPRSVALVALVAFVAFAAPPPPPPSLVRFAVAFERSDGASHASVEPFRSAATVRAPKRHANAVPAARPSALTTTRVPPPAGPDAGVADRTASVRSGCHHNASLVYSNELSDTARRTAGGAAVPPPPPSSGGEEHTSSSTSGPTCVAGTTGPPSPKRQRGAVPKRRWLPTMRTRTPPYAEPEPGNTASAVGCAKKEKLPAGSKPRPSSASDTRTTSAPAAHAGVLQLTIADADAPPPSSAPRSSAPTDWLPFPDSKRQVRVELKRPTTERGSPAPPTVTTVPPAAGPSSGASEPASVKYEKAAASPSSPSSSPSSS